MRHRLHTANHHRPPEGQVRRAHVCLLAMFLMHLHQSQHSISRVTAVWRVSETTHHLSKCLSITAMMFFFLLLFAHFSCRSNWFSLSGCCLASLQSLGEVGFLPAVSMCVSLLCRSALSAEAEMCWSLFSSPYWNSRSLYY